VLLVGLGSPLAMAGGTPTPPPKTTRVLKYFVPRVSSAMPKASMDVVFLVPRFHLRDACPMPVVSPCCESV
jgi:hypothetical protein